MIICLISFTCSIKIKNTPSQTNVQSNNNAIAPQTEKQVQNLDKSADSLINARKQYENILDKPFDVDTDPRYAQLTKEQKEIVLEAQKRARENLQQQIQKITETSQKIRTNSVKIHQQLDDASEVANKAKSIQHASEKSNAEHSTENRQRNSYISTNLKKSKDIDNVLDSIGIAQTCTKAFFESVPPSICWKKGGDIGRIPTDCPQGFFRYLALCFENCAPGYQFDGGALCIAGCPDGYSTQPLTCYKWPFTITARKAYFPKSITNFEAPCFDGYYRSGALCYRDCNRVGMVNCGIGMCAASNEACAAGVSQMVVDTVSSIGKGVGFVLSFGTSAAATQGISSAKEAMSKSLDAVKNAAKSGLAFMKNLVNNPEIRKAFMKKAMEAAQEKLKQYAIDKLKETAITNVCGTLHDALVKKVASSEEPKGIWDKLDVLGVGEINKNCKNPDGTNGGIACAKSILSSLDSIDPTGLVGLASAFMHPICDI